ncbi:unnamed protein product [Boreogadus saida]
MISQRCVNNAGFHCFPLKGPEGQHHSQPLLSESKTLQPHSPVASLPRVIISSATVDGGPGRPLLSDRSCETGASDCCSGFNTEKLGIDSEK